MAKKDWHMISKKYSQNNSFFETIPMNIGIAGSERGEAGCGISRTPHENAIRKWQHDKDGIICMKGYPRATPDGNFVGFFFSLSKGAVSTAN